MKNNLKNMFFMLFIMSTMFLISSSNWLNMWIWLEINLISFISFMINNKNKLSIESSLIYFLIQTIASIIMIFSIIMMMFFYNFLMLMIITLLMKLGSSPFHYWLPLIIKGLNWTKIFFLLTWQKINPLMMLMLNNNMKMLNIFILLSMILGSFSSFNYNSMKKILSYSSINQLSWLMISLNFYKIMKIYLLFYFYLMWMITKLLKLLNINFMNQIFNLNLKNKFMKIFMFSNFMSLGGLPPFLGFFPKMMIIMKLNNYYLMFLMIIFSLIMLFIYLRMMMMMIMLNSLKINMNYKKFNNKKIKKMMINSMINNLMIMMFFFFY